MNQTPDLFDSLPPEAAGSASQPPAPPPPALPLTGTDDALPLDLYAERAYLAYAMSVVKARALPQVEDGMKPVQRRILYAMSEMRLSPTSKHVKSARVVGDVIGKYHPHGDSSVYDAMVRVAQDFSLRYPLVDGQGNFGSRDGDSAAAMRYTECRLTGIAELLLSEIDRGTVDFRPNYDGAFEEPQLLPARLPFVLLNGASGIAVGMATEIPSHNLREVASAAIHAIENPHASVADLLGHIKGPDYPGGGQLISPAGDIRAAYESGRGSLKLRARWIIEDLARGQWQLVITELPPGVSAQKILFEIETLTNPQPKTGKKSIDPDQAQLKALMLGALDRVRDESGKDATVRLVFEPKSRNQDVAEFANLLLSHTSLETSSSINLVMIGLDGRPGQKNLAEILHEWGRFRLATVRRRTAHRLGQVNDRIHILEGRHIVFLNIDEVIRIIRNSDEPKPALIERFALSDRQAEDILEIRLRQLARLEGIKIERELAELRGEKSELEALLAEEGKLKKLVIKEIRADAAKFGDERRTVVEEAARAGITQTVVDEAVTVIVSEKGWVRCRNGHGLDLANVAFKDGDHLAAAFECRSVDSLIAITDGGRALTVAVSGLPDGRGNGAPLASLVELPSGSKIAHVLAGHADNRVLLATADGYGFLCRLGDMTATKRAGKQFINLEGGSRLLAPVLYAQGENQHLVALSSTGRLLIFTLDQMKELSGGGKGVIIIGLDAGEELAAACVAGDSVTLLASTRGGKAVEFNLAARDWEAWLGKRARKGKPAPGRSQSNGLRSH
ncbi:MAG: DNA topoisomerase IV subunit A [Zoogloea oleivorans]|jgi:topoisomerase-4 subunit A|uniref:DNA topoisomerase IV subunit A n=1 Tax=Zoogloea oleivorans TaxID=1552750 RepID=UPI002A364452|nr:DNA topoisomerase IV subunit A [Zoogloea oleivorans]MDY0035360.1 DNA topoisomerase IV subunit A [Zoogloea oleivorans]